MAQTTIDKVKHAITNSGFNDDLKNRLIVALPLLDKHTLSGLESELNRADSLLIAEKITNLWERFGRIVSGIKNRQADSKDDFFSLFHETQQFLNEEDKLYVVNLTTDILHILKRIPIFSEKEFRDLVEYEISLFRYLPADEIDFFLEYYSLFILGRINLLREIQVAMTSQDRTAEITSFKPFSDALLRNQEILGSKTIKTIGGWIQEFINFKSTSIFQKNSLDIAEFLSKQVPVNSLTQEEKLILSQILNLFLWFINPVIDEKELVWYIQQAEQEKLKFYELLYSLDQAGKTASAPKYIWDARILMKTVPSVSTSQAHLVHRDAAAKLQVHSPSRIIQPPSPGRQFMKKILPLPPRPSREATADAVRPQREGLRSSPLPNPRPNAPGGQAPHQGEGKESEGRREAPVVPRKKVMNTELYRKTLEELAKRREEYEKKIQNAKAEILSKPPTPPGPPSGGPPSPRQERENGREASPPLMPRTIGYDEPFSVNEAVYRGDIQQTKERGEIVKGQEEVEDKLKSLKNKITNGRKDEKTEEQK